MARARFADQAMWYTVTPVALIRRLLYLDALLSALGGVALLALPRFLLQTLLGQAALPDYAWPRLTGVAGFTLALLMVLVAHRVEELWWWSWAFVVLEAGAGAVTTLHALVGLPAGAAAWPWWIMAVLSWGCAGGFLWGLAKAGIERPPGSAGS